MAKGDLFNLLSKISEEVNSRSTDLRPYLDRYPHIIEISSKSIEQQVSIQIAEFLQPGRKSGEQLLSRKYGVTNGLNAEDSLAALQAEGVELNAKAKEYCQLFARNVFKFLEQSKGNLYEVKKLSGSDTEYTVSIEYVGLKSTATPKKDFLVKDSSDVFRFIQEKGLAPAQSALRNQLIGIYKTIGRSTKAGDRLFDLGHITAVSQVKRETAVRALERIKTSPQYSDVLAGLMKYELISKFSASSELNKFFEGKVVYARPEAVAFNNVQSKFETELLKEVQNALKQVVESNVDWANQAGSDTIVEAIAKELIGTAVKRGAKGNLSKIDRAPSKASLAKTLKKKVVTRKLGKPNVSTPSPLPEAGKSAVDLRSLIPILNQRLPEVVRSNMGIGGRLRNRTGRFSESARVVEIGGDVMSYSYQRNPYQVFESQGPRDPRPLIEGSIRELAASLTRQKFNLRRV